VSRAFGASRRFVLCAGSALIALVAVAAHAATPSACERAYTPRLGQPGKDVMWLPTSERLVARMLDAARVTPADVVYDLGAGDGRIVVAAAKRGAKAVGIEYNPKLVELARCLVQADGLSDRARIVQGDLFTASFADATVVALYLLPELDLRLRPELLALRPGTRIVSHSYLMGDWSPDERIETPEGLAYLWVVPAHVDGSWVFRARRGRGRFAVTFIQTFQSLSGLVGDEGQALIGATIAGPRVSFAFRDEDGGLVHVAGEVDGARIDARVTRRGESADYIAARAG